MTTKIVLTKVAEVATESDLRALFKGSSIESITFHRFSPQFFGRAATVTFASPQAAVAALSKSPRQTPPQIRTYTPNWFSIHSLQSLWGNQNASTTR
jgi:hypothetical protein